MRRKVLLAGLLAIAVAAGGSAAAETMRGSKPLLDGQDRSGCRVHLISMTRVDREAKRKRFVRVATKLDCPASDVDWTDAHMTVRVYGQFSWGLGTRALVAQGYPDGVKAGRSIRLTRKLKCNVKEDGEWQEPRSSLDMWAWGEVHQDDQSQSQWHVAQVQDNRTTVYC